jgi:hypothetical protein
LNPSIGGDVTRATLLFYNGTCVQNNKQLISVMRKGSGNPRLFKFWEFLYEKIAEKIDASDKPPPQFRAWKVIKMKRKNKV